MICSCVRMAERKMDGVGYPRHAMTLGISFLAHKLDILIYKIINYKVIVTHFDIVSQLQPRFLEISCGIHGKIQCLYTYT